ncbi:MAG: BolA family transcriptional regulator [Bdellovibrionaceae bacterium]|nr:BolA family transcriptional regulator [Pseudobdellovibrionaceae bacterium]
MSIEKQIIDKIKKEFDPVYFELENESHKHAHGGLESHFKLLVVSDKFSGMTRVARQRYIYNLLNEEMTKGIHALAQRVLTFKEWEEQKSPLETPNCKKVPG